MISGADCCSPNGFYLFPQTGSRFKTRIGVAGEIPKVEGDYGPGKKESRPFLLDWDRDGTVEFVYLWHGTAVASVGQEKANSARLEEDALAKWAGAVEWERNTRLLVLTGPSKKAGDEEHPQLAFEFVDFDPDEHNPFPLDSSFEVKGIGVEFTIGFGDVNHDGAFDMLFIPHYSRPNFQKTFRDQNPESEEDVEKKLQKARAMEALYVMLNETQTGQPVFGEPIKLAESLNATSIAVGNVDGDGKNEIGLSGLSPIGARTRILSTTIFPMGEK